MVLDLDFESRLVLHAKRCKLKLANFTICLEKYKFLQTTPNVGNIYIYIYQTEAHETLVKNPKSIPQESPLFGRKMAGKPRLYCGTSPEKLQFTENDGCGWIDLEMLSSKLMELAGKLAKDG